jgi:glycerol-3-phosphate dehydrogenase
MTRDLDALSRRTFDVLVVGGGIHGLITACDAARRGFAVALVDRSDFGSGSSFNHLRTIHGGLRYLQTLDVGRARESVRERRTLARIAPHSVRPVPFVLPLYRSLLRGKLALRAGFLIDRVIGWDRNARVPAGLELPASRVVSRAQAIERFPGLRRQGLTGAAIWHDYVTTEADRLTFSWAVAAHQHGAVLANYVEAKELIAEAGKIVGVHASDRQSGGSFPIHATITVNASGGRFRPQPAGTPPRPLLKAMNLVTSRDAGGEALGGPSASGRNFFLVPWRDHAVFGTWESRAPCTPDQAAPSEQEVRDFLNELNAAFPALDLRRDEITLVHRGAVPADVSADGSARLAGDARIEDHAAARADGLLTVTGTKYTTARAVAERVVDRLTEKSGRTLRACETATTPLPGGDIANLTAMIGEARRLWDDRLPSDTVPHLVAAYGSRYGEVLALGAARRDWLERVVDGSPVIGAELVWAVRHELALTLEDAVLRRTPLGALGYPGDAAARRAADIIGTELRWDEARRRQEIAQLQAFYEL